jgi:hypothetical protein
VAQPESQPSNPPQRRQSRLRQQKGARDRPSAALLRALLDYFAEHGEEAIKKLREQDHSTYCRIVTSLQPKEIERRSTITERIHVP